MTRSLARLRTLACAAAAAAVLSACAGSGIGVAARIGETRITHDAVADRVDRGWVGQATRQIDRADLQRLWISQMLKEHVYRETLRRLGVTPTKEQLDKGYEAFALQRGGEAQMVQQLTGAGVHKDDIREVIDGNTMYELIGDKLIEDVTTTEEQLRAEYRKRLAELDLAHVAHIKVKDKATADRIVAQARGGADFAKLAEQSLDAATAPEGGDLGIIGNGPGRFEQQIVQAVFRAKTGDVIGPFRLRDGTYDVWKVIERRTTTFEQARDLLRRTLVEPERNKRRKEYIDSVVRDLTLSVNPRYGRWDVESFAVVPDDGELSQLEVTPGVADPKAGAPGGGP